MKPLRSILDALINKGTEFYDSFEEKKRTRQINILNLLVVSALLPGLIIYKSIEGKYVELYVLIPVTLLFILVFNLNRRGRTQLANMIAMSSVIIGAYCIILISEKQTELPFLFILLAFGAIHFINHKIVKNVMLVITLISYVLTEYYNSKYLPFDENEYFFLIALLFFYYIQLRNWDDQNKKYQKVIEENNNELEQKNTKIQQQSDKLIQVQKLTHELELTQKQKDMDTVLANQAMQIKLKENIVEQLNEAVKSENPSKEIRSVILQLKGQAETQKKLSLLSENLEEVNAVLYERLLTNHPDLTKSEREMCAFIRLGLSGKEIASIKNITENSVTVLKTRLRKKLKLNTNYELGAYLLQY